MWADIRAAFSFLTILPLGYAEGRKPGWSFAWFPLVGLLIGVILALIASFSPFEHSVNTFLVLAAWVVMTGGLHLDGFGDSCDGLLATVEPERRLEIMKDPRAGSWAVVGLVLLLLGKWVTIGTVLPRLLILPPILGRWAMVIAAYRFPYARQSGMGSYYRDGLGNAQVTVATGLTLISTIVAAHDVVTAVILLGMSLVTVLIVGQWAARRLGEGITGDVYGAICELTELLCLLGLSLWVNG